MEKNFRKQTKSILVSTPTKKKKNQSTSSCRTEIWVSGIALRGFFIFSLIAFLIFQCSAVYPQTNMCVGASFFFFFNKSVGASLIKINK